MKFDSFGASKHREGKSLSKRDFAILISTLGRYRRASKKKICHIHFNADDDMTPEDSSLLREVDLRKMVLKAVMKDDNKKKFSIIF